MSVQDSDATMAVFLDLENIALGAHDADFPAIRYPQGSRASAAQGPNRGQETYCDFERYKTFKRGLHEAAFELIEIPHVRQSGKNSADIRMVVDALDLCYTKGHVDTFVIISGDSESSPQSSANCARTTRRSSASALKGRLSLLFISNCDEFVYYDDLCAWKPVEKCPSVAATAPTAKTRKDHRPSIDGALDVLRKTLEALPAKRVEDYPIPRLTHERGDETSKPRFQRASAWVPCLQRTPPEAQKRGLLKLERDRQVGTTSCRTIRV